MIFIISPKEVSFSSVSPENTITVLNIYGKQLRIITCFHLNPDFTKKFSSSRCQITFYQRIQMCNGLFSFKVFAGE